MIPSARMTSVKFAAFFVVMALLTVSLFFVFGQYQTGSKDDYSAVFANVSELESGDTVRVAGVRVGTVNSVQLSDDNTVLVKFDTDRNIVLTVSTRAVVRYLNLVGDRYLDLTDTAGPTTIQPVGSQIPIDRTAPALDLDLLLGGLKPVIQGLNPKDVNALTNSLIQIFQGEGPTLESLFSRTSTFTNALADNDATIKQLIDNLKKVVATIAQKGDEFSGAIDKLERLISGLSKDRDPIGSAIEALNNGSASLADLLTSARQPLAGTVEQLSRVAPLLDEDKDLLDAQLARLPENFRKLARQGAYGSFINYYVCGISFRASDLQGNTVVFPWIKQEGGRCAEP
jgi:phospholipid/cholesterol/gamma-HCH transport system substrate-binding protein